MKKRKLGWSLSIVLVVLLCALGGLTYSQASTERLVGIRLLHTQEHHGQALPVRGGNPALDLGGLSARATLIASERIDAGKKNLGVLVLDSGDILTGTPLSSEFRGEPDIWAMNVIGYDALTPGNHEFDFEPKEPRFRALAGLAKFPLLAANVKGIEALAIAKPNPGFIIKKIENLRIGIIGITNPMTGEVSNPPAGLTFEDSIVTVKTILAEQKANADLWIALTHQETFRDLALLRAVPELDLVIGGHTVGFQGIVTRDAFKDPIDEKTVPDLVPAQPTDVLNPNGIYVRAGEGPFFGRFGTVVGRLDIFFDSATKKIAKASSTNLLVVPATEHNKQAGVPTVALDAKIEALLQPFVAALNRRLKEIIGKTLVELNGRREDVRVRETNLGNLITDAYRVMQKTEISLQNAGGIRSSVRPGEIMRSDVISILPFGNTIVRFKIQGADLLTALENGVSQVEQKGGRFPQISGMCLSFDPSRPVGQRILKVFVGKKPLEPDATYTIATNNFTANGGDGYVSFRDRRSEFRDTESVDTDLFADYLRAQGTISPKLEGRITEGGAKTACE
jgi:2',3'-cyclic-nucleotide 2'-phosphodiesterase (5'-nucleotidase family)